MQGKTVEAGDKRHCCLRERNGTLMAERDTHSEALVSTRWVAEQLNDARVRLVEVVGARATHRTGIEVGAAPDGLLTSDAGPGNTRREGALEEAWPRHRPDVSGSFTVALVCALGSGFFLGTDLFREEIGIGQILAFAIVHPMSYVLGCCVALLAILLAVGDV
jgi:hypothetical protein